MRAKINQFVTLLIGSAQNFSLEHRLFNTVSLINGVSNLGGTVSSVAMASVRWLWALHLVTGILFLLFYIVARTRGVYRRLYWGFVILIAVFLFTNAIGNAGTTGGAIHYFIPALVIAAMLSDKIWKNFTALMLFGAATIALAVIEYKKPELIMSYPNAAERFSDVTSNLLFAQFLSLSLVTILARAHTRERRKSDKLLLNILPAKVARELRETGRVHPVAYKSATVLFTDFVGFTSSAEHFTPQDLIAELDSFFRAFDSIARKHNLEKIKTIGDAYMAVGGIPAPNTTHARDCVEAGLEIVAFVKAMMKQRMAEGHPGWQIRVGIHTGELVAGVVGSDKFSYDVWGDTVNTASRMESAGTPGRVNISGATFELVRRDFACESRGLVKAKGKGELEMFFVNQALTAPQVSARREVGEITLQPTDFTHSFE